MPHYDVILRTHFMRKSIYERTTQPITKSHNTFLNLMNKRLQLCQLDTVTYIYMLYYIHIPTLFHSESKTVYFKLYTVHLYCY